MTKQETYASVVWTAEDIKTLRSKWSTRRCTKFLLRSCATYLDRLVEQGWLVIEDLIGMDESEP